jgi:lysophospholipase L1-like esterase
MQDRLATTAGGTGEATLNVQGGSWLTTITALPPYYQRGPDSTVTVPVADGQPVRLPVTLRIGSNRPNVYMAFGDSITEGEGSKNDLGYRDNLQAELGEWFGAGRIENQGLSGTRSNAGAARVRESLDKTKPAYTLILYGTNDWNDYSCRSEFPCFTIDSLRTMVRAAKNRQSMPILSTIIPCNTGYDARVPPSRNLWIADMNALIVEMAHEEQVPVADSFAAFMAAPDLHALFFDHVHPNDAGYDILAQTFFDAISQQAAAATSRPVPVLLAPPGAYPETVPPDPADVPRPSHEGAL